MHSTRAPIRVLIAGGGLTGALTAHAPKQAAAAGGVGVHITVWESARGAGGRMSTTRWQRDGRGGRSVEVAANTGAQYVSAAEHGPCAPLLGEAMAAGVLAGPLPPPQVSPHSRCFECHAGSSGGGGAAPAPVRDYAAPRGTSAVVKFFLRAADSSRFSARLQSLSVSVGAAAAGPASAGAGCGGSQWLASGSTGGGGGGGGGDGNSLRQQFDAVVLAMPPKDAARVKGPGLEAALRPAGRTRFRSRFSLSLFWGEGTNYFSTAENSY